MSEEKSGPIVQKAKSKRKYYDETSAEGSELPIKFTSSNAFGAISSERLGLGQREKKMPPPTIQTHSLVISMSIFMLYFFFLREENDLDLMITDLGKAENMYEKVQGLEEAHLRDAIQAREIQGIDVRDLKAKLAELESQKET